MKVNRDSQRHLTTDTFIDREALGSIHSSVCPFVMLSCLNDLIYDLHFTIKYEEKGSHYHCDAFVCVSVSRGYTHYILRLTDPDMGCSGLSEKKKIKICLNVNVGGKKKITGEIQEFH